MKCKCNNPDPLLCHECEESTGVCYCKCHEGFKRVPRTSAREVAIALAEEFRKRGQYER